VYTPLFLVISKVKPLPFICWFTPVIPEYVATAGTAVPLAPTLVITPVVILSTDSIVKVKSFPGLAPPIVFSPAGIVIVCPTPYPVPPLFTLTL